MQLPGIPDHRNIFLKLFPGNIKAKAKLSFVPSGKAFK